MLDREREKKKKKKKRKEKGEKRRPMNYTRNIKNRKDKFFVT